MKTNLLFFLNSYNDLHQTTTPALNQFKWSREINGIPYNIENSQQIQIAAGATSPNLLPYNFSTPANSGTDTTHSNATLTIVGPTTGIAAGQLIVGSGIPVGTTVLNIVGSTVTMSQPATASASVAVSFYNPAAFVYLESDQQISMIYNNGSPVILNPFEINGLTQPAVFFIAGGAFNLTVTNPGTVTANVFFASMG